MTALYIATRAEAVYLSTFDEVTGTLSEPEPVIQLPYVHWLLKHPTLPVLYTAGGRDGVIRAFRIAGDGSLTSAGESGTDDAGLASAYLDGPSGTILTAGFGAGTVSWIPLRQDGTPLERTGAAHGNGSGPHPRQDGPHIHGVTVEPGGQFVVATDFGSDTIGVYGFDRGLQAPACSQPEPHSRSRAGLDQGRGTWCSTRG